MKECVSTMADPLNNLFQIIDASFVTLAEPLADVTDANLIVEDALNFVHDAMDAADDTSDPAVNALLNEAKKLQASIPKHGPVPPMLVNQLKSTFQKIHVAMEQAAMASERTHANQKSVSLDAVEDARREVAVTRQRIEQRQQENQQRHEASEAAEHRATLLREAEDEQGLSGALRGGMRTIMGSQAVGAVVRGARAVQHKSVTAASAAGLVFHGLITDDSDAMHKGVDIARFGTRNVLLELTGNEWLAQNVGHSVGVVGETQVGVVVGVGDVVMGAVRVVTLQGDEKDATNVSRGIARSLVSVGVNAQSAETAARHVGDTMRSGARLSQDAGNAVESSVEAARRQAAGIAAEAQRRAAEAQRQAARAVDNTRDAGADAGIRLSSSFGRQVDAQLATLNSQRNLVRQFDTDGDGKAELHEVVAKLRQMGLDNATDFGNGDRTLSGAEFFRGVAARLRGQSPRN